MSLSGALSNALSGMTANARKAGIVSTNISNALTEGYGRRELAVSPSMIGTYGGVSVTPSCAMRTRPSFRIVGCLMRQQALPTQCKAMRRGSNV